MPIVSQKYNYNTTSIMKGLITITIKINVMKPVKYLSLTQLLRHIFSVFLNTLHKNSGNSPCRKF